MALRQKLSYWMIPVLVFFFLFEGFIRCARAMTTEEEKKLGKKILLEITRQVELVNDLTVQVFVDKIANSILREVGSTPYEFKFFVIKAQDPNAFAIPGGYVFVTTGLIVLAENEQEIAGVLGHEISHITGRHIDQMIERSKRLNIATLAAIVAGALVGRGGVGTQAVAATAAAAAETLALKYSREHETNADQNGLYRMVKAGYDPNGMISFLSKIQRLSLSTAPQIPSYLLTHPALEDRIALLQNLLQTGPRPAGPFKKVENFKRVQSKAFVEEREPEVAVNHFGSRIKGNPQDVDEIYGLGLALKKMGRLDKSIEVFQNGLSLSPQDPDLLREMGIAYFLSGKVDQAIENFEAIQSVKTAELNQGEDLWALYYLGRGYQEKGDFAKALPLFLKVKKEYPDFIDVYHGLGSVYGRTGQKGLSHFFFAKYFKLRGDHKDALLHFRTALQWLEKGGLERDEAQREIKELTQTQ